jgi:hypothetical protein
MNAKVPGPELTKNIGVTISRSNRKNKQGRGEELMQMCSNESADRLNGLLEDELVAVETYRQAARKIDDPLIRAGLQEIEDNHASRVQMLTESVVRLGEKPVLTAGPKGAFARILEGAAQLLGDKEALTVLEEGEKSELRDYRRLLHSQDPEVLPLLYELLPQAETTYAKVCNLKGHLH